MLLRIGRLLPLYFFLMFVIFGLEALHWLFDISIYDGKEASSKYAFDTPCTCAVHFHIVDNKLDMSVMMRSNDLWYGFPNDQYCFSKLQKMVADDVDISIGKYYHFVTNLHIYNDKLKKQ